MTSLQTDEEVLIDKGKDDARGNIEERTGAKSPHTALRRVYYV